MKYLIAATILTAVGIAVVGGVAVAVVCRCCRCLARDEDAHDETCVAPCCDPGPDDLEAVAEAVGVLVTAPLSWELAKTPGVRAMTLIDRAAFLATARDIDSLPIYRGGVS